jgi:hypothetical protein
MSAAAARVSEDHDATRPLGHRQIGFERDGSRRKMDELLAAL